MTALRRHLDSATTLLFASKVAMKCAVLVLIPGGRSSALQAANDPNRLQARNDRAIQHPYYDIVDTSCSGRVCQAKNADHESITTLAHYEQSLTNSDILFAVMLRQVSSARQRPRLSIRGFEKLLLNNSSFDG